MSLLPVFADLCQGKSDNQSNETTEYQCDHEDYKVFAIVREDATNDRGSHL